MAARADSVSKYLCAKSGWKITNLQLQKLLYLSQMIYMGRNEGARLMDADFEAWDFGPVAPVIYKKVRMFGGAPIEDVFFEALSFKSEDSRKKLLDEICQDVLPLRASQLVEITHWEKGAWAARYEPGTRGIRIPDAYILQEYRDRISEGKLIDDEKYRSRSSPERVGAGD